MKPHPFKTDPIDNIICAYCGRTPIDTLHTNLQQRFTEKFGFPEGLGNGRYISTDEILAFIKAELLALVEEVEGLKIEGKITEYDVAIDEATTLIRNRSNEI